MEFLCGHILLYIGVSIKEGLQVEAIYLLTQYKLEV